MRVQPWVVLGHGQLCPCVKSISSSIDGINPEIEKEIRNLPIGTALVTGIVDLPLFVNVRPRRTKHGGETIDVGLSVENRIEESNVENENFTDKVEEFKNEGELMLLIKQKVSKKDLMLMEDRKDVKTSLIPCLLV